MLKLNQITTAHLSMAPAQRKAIHQSIRVSQVEMPINELFQPLFDVFPFCPHCTSTHLKKWEKSDKVGGLLTVRHVNMTVENQISAYFYCA